MQFVTNGPDIPDSLLQAHEEGKVVFFCGAGISVPAGLPGFAALVDKIYDITGTHRDPIESSSFKAQQYDATLNLLEHRLPDGRMAMRKALVESLSRSRWPKKATDTHSALLRLAKTHNGKIRLITTNFDSLFELAGKRIKQSFETFRAPMLPVPKSSRWDGLVYLHGAITGKMDESALNRLVVTSGDFGQAYLTERWAARFVSELFRNFVVCFVGYGINDPVLRYMMDALAADKRQGEATQPAWAFAGFKEGEAQETYIEWEAKGVTPILYKVLKPTENTQDHSLLHRTIHSWAGTYRDGVTGKERIVIDYALAQPSKSTVQDDFVGRMLWALSDGTGLPAKCLARHNPAPSLDWLFKGIMQERYGHEDLKRFGVIPREEPDDSLKFSLTSRPAPYHLSPLMTFFSVNQSSAQWDDIMNHLADWLIRYLDEPKLLISMANSGGDLHVYFRHKIAKRIGLLTQLEREGNIAKLDEIRANSPMAIPGANMKKLWELFLGRRIKTSRFNSDISEWVQRICSEELSATMRFELRALLAPKILLQEPYHFPSLSNEENENSTSNISQLAHWEVVLNVDHARSILDNGNNKRFQQILPALFDDLQQLLRDALDLIQMMGEADENSDSSLWAMPSISHHQQNHRFKDWTLLIELLRDAWMAILPNDSARAMRAVIGWYQLPYPVFKRLAFFAAANSDVISSTQWVDWLTEKEAQWLWSPETGREVFRLLVQQGKSLSACDQERLEAAIMAGPLKEWFAVDEKQEQFKHYFDRSRWLALAKLQSSGLSLSDAAKAQLQELTNTYPKWKLAQDERDEFSVWAGDVADYDNDDRQQHIPAPETWQEMVQWLQDHPKEQRMYGSDGWRERCSTHFEQSLMALQLLVEESIIPVWRWREALQAWSKDDMAQRTWNMAAPVVAILPDDVLLELKHSLAWWIEASSKTLTTYIDVFRSLCMRMLKLPFEAKSGTLVNGKPIDDPVSEAISHPVGYITEALINELFRGEMQDDDLLPEWLKAVFTELCSLQTDRFRHGRVILAANVISLFRVDPEWTTSNLLPLFNWNNAPEARAMWEGFLWSPRLHKPLFDVFRHDFIRTANHYVILGKHKDQYVTMLTYVALDMAEGFDKAELQAAFDVLPNDGLESVVQALSRALAGAGEQQREAYWLNRIRPFWKSMWPQSQDRITTRISERLVQLILASGCEFPSAFRMVKSWLRPAEFLFYPIHLLEKYGVCKLFPNESLELLSILVAGQDYPPSELNLCLEEIIASKPDLIANDAYIRLNNYLRSRTP